MGRGEANDDEIISLVCWLCWMSILGLLVFFGAFYGLFEPVFLAERNYSPTFCHVTNVQRGAAVFSGARLLLRQNNQLEKGKELALRSLAQLDQLRLNLQEKLEAELAKAEARWGEERFAALRLAAQRLADQLAEVEELEERLRRQFEPGEDR